jgi:DNA-binding transcriptional regulator LsrR (DeoR family)
LELLAQGFNQSQIATQLQLPRQTVSDDVRVLREESKERIRSHLEKSLPLAYETCLATLMDTKRRAYEIANKKETDEMTKLQVIQIINDSAIKYMDVITHNETVKIVMSWANKANKQLETTTKPGEGEVEDKDKADSAQDNNVRTNSNDTQGPAETTRDKTESRAAAVVVVVVV